MIFPQIMLYKHAKKCKLYKIKHERIKYACLKKKIHKPIVRKLFVMFHAL